MDKSLINIALDLVELDETAPENQAIVVDRIKSLGHKVGSYVGMDKFCDSQIDMIDAEIEHLQRQKNKFKSIKDHLRCGAEQVLNLLNVPELKSDNGHKIYFRKSERVDFTDASLIPADFMRTKTTVEPDKDKIKRAIKAGDGVPGAFIDEIKTIAFK